MLRNLKTSLGMFLLESVIRRWRVGKAHKGIISLHHASVDNGMFLGPIDGAGDHLISKLWVEV